MEISDKSGGSSAQQSGYDAVVMNLVSLQCIAIQQEQQEDM